jgi:hypothetical protein
MTRCPEDGNGYPAGGLWAGAGHNPLSAVGTGRLNESDEVVQRPRGIQPRLARHYGSHPPVEAEERAYQEYSTESITSRITNYTLDSHSLHFQEQRDRRRPTERASQPGLVLDGRCPCRCRRGSEELGSSSRIHHTLRWISSLTDIRLKRICGLC